METRLLRTFQRQVEMQCRYALKAARQLSGIMAGSINEDHWFWIEAFLEASANISRALWPNQNRKHPIDREPLRRSLAVDDTSPLQMRHMRNHFTHFDERLEEWWVKDPNHNSVDATIMPRSMKTGYPDISFFRLLDPQSGDLMFWGDVYHIPSIVREIERILPIAAAEGQRPHWKS